MSENNARRFTEEDKALAQEAIDSITMESIEAVQSVAVFAMKLGEINRITLHPDGERLETDSTHVVMLGVVACSFARRSSMDIGRIAELCLVHDMVEAELGEDAPTLVISKEAREAKKRREHEALLRIYDRFKRSSPWLCERLREYEARKTMESVYVYIMDKLAPKLTQAANQGASVRRQGVSADQLVELHDKQLAEIRAMFANRGSFVEAALKLLKAGMDLAVQACRDGEKKGIAFLRPIAGKASDQQLLDVYLHRATLSQVAL